MPTLEPLGPDIRIHPAPPLAGRIRPPGSKSLTNRALACAALADGASVLRGAAICDDSARMIAGLRALGIACADEPTHARVRIDGCGGQPPAERAELDAGAAGTAMRFLTAIAAVGDGEYRVDGAARMRARPIGALVDGLRALGARIDYAGAAGYPPLLLDACGLLGGALRLDHPPSSQFVSALLMAAPYASADVQIEVGGALPSEPYVEMTLHVMRRFGLEALHVGQRFIVPAPQRGVGADLEIEPDASAATYFWAAAAITGGTVRVDGLSSGSLQGDAAFVDVLARMGCRVENGADHIRVSGPPAGTLRGTDADLNAMPDTAQTLAVAALFAEGPTTIRNVPNLRIKETDRITALATELGKFGARVDVRADGMTIHPPREPRYAEVDTYDDHRMAMSFALAGLRCGALIRAAGVVSKSYPGYFDDLARLLAAQAERSGD